MPTPIIRHHEVVGALGPGGFSAIRDRSATKPKATTIPGATAKVREMRRTVDAIGETHDRLSESLTRLHNALAPRAERVRAARDAEARYAVQADRCSPAGVNAANRARWGRPGR